MAANVVTLDALIPREDFAVESTPRPGSPNDKIDVVHLEGHFFGSLLRKPDFQRETNQWTPEGRSGGALVIPVVIASEARQLQFVCLRWIAASLRCSQ